MVYEDCTSALLRSHILHFVLVYTNTAAVRGVTGDLGGIPVSLQRVLSIILMVLHSPPVNGNPLELRLRTILLEEHDILRKALKIAGDDSLPTGELRTLIAVVYRDDDVAQLTFREWVRASTWAKSAAPGILRTMERMFRRMRRELVNIVPELQQTFGFENVRYMVPAKYWCPPVEVHR